MTCTEEMITFISLQSQTSREKIAFEERIWEDNIKMDLSEIEFKDVNLIHLCQDQVHWQSLPKNCSEPSGSI